MRKYGFLLLPLLVGAFCLCTAQTARAEYDYFDGFDTGINSAYWTAETTAGSTATVAWKNPSGYEYVQVVDDTSNGDAFVGLKFNTPISGNFSASITYNLVNWTSNSYERSGIRSDVGAMERDSDNRYGPQPELYLSDYNSILTAVPTSDTNGRLRIKREGSWVGFAYYNTSASNNWTWIYNNTAAGQGPVTLDFGLWAQDGSGTQKVNFDDFNLHAYDMPSAAPEPVSCTLLLLGGGALALARRKKS